MHEQSHAGAPPATEKTIESLKRTVVVADMDRTPLGECCNITHDAYEVGDVVVCLPCGHSYKEDSIIQWLKMHDTCPVCRIRVPKSDEETGAAVVGDHEIDAMS
jgi:E3 ubiquitin-protein ligase RNF115/126